MNARGRPERQRGKGVELAERLETTVDAPGGRRVCRPLCTQEVNGIADVIGGKLGQPDWLLR